MILKKWCKKLKPNEIIVIRGTHDYANGICLGEILTNQLQLMGLPAKFVGEEVIVDRILFEHGYGFSSYYPFSYTLLRNTERKLLQYLAEGKEIERCCFGHSHWLMTGFGLTIHHYLDCTGGFQRNERAVLGRTLRPVGGIVYIERQPVEIPVCWEDLRKDATDELLHQHNLQEIANTMVEYEKIRRMVLDREKYWESLGGG
jgi:hypothetical protein